MVLRQDRENSPVYGFHKGKERKRDGTTGAWRLETKIVCNTGLAPTCNARTPNDRMDEQGSHQEAQVERHVKDSEGKCRSY